MKLIQVNGTAFASYGSTTLPLSLHEKCSPHGSLSVLAQ